MYNDVELFDEPTNEIAPVNNGGGLLDNDADNILYLAERADKYIEALNKIMTAALKITTELDWTIISGKPYLQETGATKVARLFGISWEKLPGTNPQVECDEEGYKTFTYKLRFYMKNDHIDCDGSRCMKEDFFAKSKGGLKKPDEINEKNVKQAAYTNCINNGIKRLVPGLRNINISDLEKAGLNAQKIGGYSHKEGSKGGASKAAADSGHVCENCGAAITQKVASYSEGKFGRKLCMKCQEEAYIDEQAQYKQ